LTRGQALACLWVALSYQFEQCRGLNMTTQNNEETDSFKTIKTQMGSTKTFKGFKYSVYSCFKRPATWWQSEIEKGNVVYSQTFRPETLLKDIEEKIFNKIDKLIEAEIKS